MILGICGKRQHGKDLFASMLVAAQPSFRQLAFARRLKDICKAVYGLSEAQVTDPIGKEMPLPAPIELDAMLDALRTAAALPDIASHGLIANTPRQVLQFVGTDYVREADPGYWLRAVSAQFSGDGDFVVTDVRFENEAAMIRANGGKVLRLLRLSKELSATNSNGPEHASEALAFEPDFTLAVCEGDFALHRVVCGMAKRGMLLDGLQAFDWDLLSFSAPIFAAYYHDLWPAMCRVADEALFGPKPEKVAA